MPEGRSRCFGDRCEIQWERPEATTLLDRGATMIQLIVWIRDFKNGASNSIGFKNFSASESKTNRPV